jgi:tight adherence protein B
MKVFILVMVFMVVSFFSLSLYYLNMDRREAAREKFLNRLARERRGSSDRETEAEDVQEGFLESIISRIIDTSTIESMLVSADSSISVGRFLSISLGMGLVFMLPPLVLMRNPFVMFLFLVMGASVPMFYFIYLRKQREETLVKQLPEAIDMITRALKAGQSLDGALHEVGRSLPLPIGGEISAVYDEIAMGLPFEAAIRNFEKRYPRIADIKILCTTFVIQRETGGNLTKILTGLATTIRERFKLKMQIKTLTAEGRVTAMILAMIPVVFVLLTWFLNPKYISILFVHPTGKKILLFALFLEGLGFYVMKKITEIKV